MPKECSDYLPAKLDKRLVVQSIARVSDGQGGFTESWSTDATVWAALEPLKGYERFQAAQLQTPVTHKVTIRYRAGVTTAQRLLYDSRVLQVKEVINPNETNNWLVLKALEQQ